MFDRFTDRSKKAMHLAKLAAKRLGHAYCGTEHMLLGLAEEGGGIAATVLLDMGVSVQRVHAEIEAIVKRGDGPTPTETPFTQRAKHALELTVEESRNLGANYIGTEHLLLGLLAEHQGIAAQVLLNFGLRLEAVRARIREFLGVDESPPPASPPPSQGRKAERPQWTLCSHTPCECQSAHKWKEYALHLAAALGALESRIRKLEQADKDRAR